MINISFVERNNKTHDGVLLGLALGITEGDSLELAEGFTEGESLGFALSSSEGNELKDYCWTGCCCRRRSGKWGFYNNLIKY